MNLIILPDRGHNGPMEYASPDDLIRFLAPYPPEVRELALEARLALLDLLFPINEVIYDATTAVCAGVLYTDHPRDCFVNLAVYAKHVTLIFSWGVALDDPEGRLRGEGTRVRHVRLDGMETMRDPYIVGLIRQAALAAPKPEHLGEPHVIVKVMKGLKRRPH